MKYLPLLLRQPHADEMVRAFLDGRKTQFRVPVKPQPRVVHGIHPDASITTNRIFRKGDQRIHSPFGTIGDRLWLKETWCWSEYAEHHEEVLWRADRDYSKDERSGYPWRSPILMPRWASRIDLEITGVRVERAQDITEEDAKAEGMESLRDRCESLADFDESITDRDLFKALWQSIYGTWDANPWVFAYTVKRIKP